MNFFMAISALLGIALAVLFSKYDCKKGQIKMVNAETPSSKVDFMCKNIFEITK